MLKVVYDSINMFEACEAQIKNYREKVARKISSSEVKFFLNCQRCNLHTQISSSAPEIRDAKLNAFKTVDEKRNQSRCPSSLVVMKG